MSKKIVFLLGSANMSGGTYVILQHARYLQKLGHQVTIALVFMSKNDFLDLRHSNRCWHPAIKELHFIHIDEAASLKFDIAIFSWWATVFSLEKINAASYLYFIQSIESRFYEKYDTFMHDLVHRTYKIGLPVITEATWIKHFLETRFQNRCELVKNGILKSIYTIEGEALEPKSLRQLRVLVEGPVDVAFKNVEKTVALCQIANVGEIWLLTSSAVQHYPGVNRVFSQVPIEQVPSIYRSCDVIVKLSYVEGMFGPPLEMFHCGGTAIVYDVTGHDEYIVHDSNGLVARTDDEQAVVNYLRLLHQDRNALSRLQAGAMETAKNWIDWDQSSQQFAQVLERTLPFTPEQKASLHTLFHKYFTERLHVITIHNNQRKEEIIECAPLYDSGFYALVLPLSAGHTQVGIVFGMCYERVAVTKLDVKNLSNNHAQMQCNLSTSELIQNADQTFTCSSRSGMLIVNVDINASMDTPSFCQLRVEFRPIAVAALELAISN